MERTQAAAEAVRMPPSCLSAFNFEALPLEEGGWDFEVTFSLTCKACASSTFVIFGFPLVAPDPSPYYMVQPGETNHRPPHKLKCASCGAEGQLFDVRTQGYDGVLNGGCSYESGTDGEAAIPGEFRVVVQVLYQAELDELAEFAREANVNVSDLFDGLTIVGTSVGGGESIFLAYECA